MFSTCCLERERRRGLRNAVGHKICEVWEGMEKGGLDMQQIRKSSFSKIYLDTATFSRHIINFVQMFEFVYSFLFLFFMKTITIFRVKILQEGEKSFETFDHGRFFPLFFIIREGNERKFISLSQSVACH